MIVGIDPGLRCTGLALHSEKGLICTSIRAKSRGLVDRVNEICSHLEGLRPVRLVVIERPQVYRQGLQKGDPNDLIGLAVLVGAMAMTLRPDRLLLPLPAEWKGQVPKEIHHRRIRARVPDLGVCSKDALDAVGLCLWGVDHAYSEER